MAKLSSRNRVTLPVEAMRAAGLHPGDEVAVHVVGDGDLLVAGCGSRMRHHAEITAGLYEPREIDRLRDQWTR